MRIIRHTQTQFAAEEKPLIRSVLFALFAIAGLVLGAAALTGGGGWPVVAATLIFAASGYALFSLDRTWMVLDREANVADLRFGKQSMLVSVDALMGATVVITADGYALAIETAIRETPVLLQSKDASPAQLELCAHNLNAWLAGRTAEPVGVGMPHFGTEPLLT